MPEGLHVSRVRIPPGGNACSSAGRAGLSFQPLVATAHDKLGECRSDYIQDPSPPSGRVMSLHPSSPRRMTITPANAREDYMPVKHRRSPERDRPSDLRRRDQSSRRMPFGLQGRAPASRQEVGGSNPPRATGSSARCPNTSRRRHKDAANAGETTRFKEVRILPSGRGSRENVSPSLVAATA